MARMKLTADEKGVMMFLAYNDVVRVEYLGDYNITDPRGTLLSLARKGLVESTRLALDDGPIRPMPAEESDEFQLTDPLGMKVAGDLAK